MTRRRQLAAGALLVAVLAGEVAGRWLITQIPFAAHVPQRAHGGVDAWPAIVVATKFGLALVLARLTWRLIRARRVVRAGERLLRIPRRQARRPRPELGLSPRAWLVSFTAMSGLYVLPTSTGEIGIGCWPLVAPWLHTPALPVFAVIAVVVALAWRTVSRWLTALERYGERLEGLARRVRAPLTLQRFARSTRRSPRALFGVSFESRPPPAVA